MNNDDLNLHSMTKLSGWLRHCVIQRYTNFAGLYFRILQYFLTKHCNFTNFKILILFEEDTLWSIAGTSNYCLKKSVDILSLSILVFPSPVIKQNSYSDDLVMVELINY